MKTGEEGMSKVNLNNRVRQAGFTMLELLVVLVILGLLAGLVGPSVIDKLGTSKSKTAKLQIQNFGQSLELYKLEVGRYPSTQEGLAALVKAPAGAAGWSGPYLKGSTSVPKDPWGNEYQYASPGQHNTKDFDIRSLGADNREGGDGENKDVSNWEE
jgi:general secretion pathway protein G